MVFEYPAVSAAVQRSHTLAGESLSRRVSHLVRAIAAQIRWRPETVIARVGVPRRLHRAFSFLLANDISTSGPQLGCGS